MNLSLTHQQRLNLIALMGAQRLSLAEMRAFWKLQDRFTLSAEEEQSIGYRIASAEGGVEIPSWDLAKSQQQEPRNFEVSEAEAQKLRKLLDEWPHFVTGIDRRWLVPLIEQLPEAQAAQGPVPMRM